MEDSGSYCGFVVNGIKLRKDIRRITDEIAMTLHSQLSVFEFQISPKERNLALAFDKPQKTKDVAALFPNASVTTVLDFENRISKSEKLFIYSIPSKFENIDEFNKLIDKFGLLASEITVEAGVFILQMRKDFDANCLFHLLPEVRFPDGQFRICLDPENVPLVKISSIPIDFTPEQLLEYVEKECHVKNHYILPKEENLYSMNLIFENNEECYKVIDNLNYTTLEGATNGELLFTHFKTREDLEKMKEWELKILGLKNAATSNEISIFFSKFGRVFSVSVSEMPSHAFVLFDKEEDAESAHKQFARKDAELSVLFKGDKSFKTVFVQNFPCNVKDADIKSVFPNALSIIVNQNKFMKGLPPSVVLTFHTEEEGKEAIKVGNSTFVRELRLFCSPFIGKGRLNLENIGVKANKDTVVLIKNFKSKVYYEDIVELCAKFGKMERVTMMKKEGRNDAGAIVQFVDKRAALECIENIGEFEMDGWVPEATPYVYPQLRAQELKKNVEEAAAVFNEKLEEENPEEETVENNEIEEEE